MKKNVPKLYVIAGCNGAGKTTASYTILPEMLQCKEFVNADEIAKGLSPFNPESVSIDAGRIMLARINGLLADKVDFAFETTLATRTYVNFIEKAHARGYHVTLIYFWLNSPDLAVSRVGMRVASGGHAIEEGVVRRRYKQGVRNLFSLYLDNADYWLIVDNSSSPFRVIADGERDKRKHVSDPLLYNEMQAI